ncbi:E3 ubiquitin-protein ligase [Canna indica]|uniref:E3 ubiquitin-protein ligase n=1 Tax=Canna indica TaxID=4628 RepID=A0AAQ3KLP2_9LILI|nr:E3 ubiquitin-protein ligase [Canna indica]
MMGRRRSHELDLQLNLSLPPVTSRIMAAPDDEEDAAASPGGCMLSSPSSCLSSEETEAEAAATMTSMVLAGCSRCLMYVMLAEDDRRCPKCGSTGLIDFFRGGSSVKKSNECSNSRKKSTMS